MHPWGQWRATLADDELRRTGTLPDFDDDRWTPVDVPGHWRTTPEFRDNDEPLLYRNRFEATAPASHRRSFLSLDGVFYQSDLWLDGAYLGDTEGYFMAHTFEVTERLRAQSQHTLAVEVTCAPPLDKTAKRSFTGVLQHWDAIDPEWNPGGIWRPVRLIETGAVRIERLRCVCMSATSARATLALRAVLDSPDSRPITLQTTIGSAHHSLTQTIAAGSNRVEWQVNIDNPLLWWPKALGQPMLTEVHVQVIDADGLSDERRFRTGLREVREKDWEFRVNGERIFLKGANQGPTRMALGDTTRVEMEALVAVAQGAGLDFLRVHGHIAHPDLYDVADTAGLLLWQDLPLQWGYARSVAKQAVRQAGEAVDLLGHHPSIFHWCAHNEPFTLDKPARETPFRYFAKQELPTWNKTVLDLRVHRALRKADKSRPATPHSGLLPGPISPGTDSHLYFGWYHGDERDLPKYLRRFPRLARFVSEFGAQAVPDGIDSWARLDADRSYQRQYLDAHVPREEPFAAWRTATQEYQAVVLRRHIEELRRIKYRPTGGFALFSLADPSDYEGVTWSVLDSRGAPKLGLAAVRAACAPVIVTADRLPAVVAAGASIGLDVHVVSDLRRALNGVSVEARLTWPGGERSWQWTGDVPADGCVRVGRVEAMLPADTSEGPVALALELRHGEGADAVVATNCFQGAVVVAV